MFRATVNEVITYLMRTDRGLCRSVNQDAAVALVKDDIGLFIVADGMGGHSKGEVASKIIVEKLESYWYKLIQFQDMPDFITVVSQIQQELQIVNKLIREQYNLGQICGSTVVILFIMKDYYAAFSVGDSRIYTCYKNKCDVLTVDDIWDTLPSTLSEYDPEQIAHHENRGKLVQAVGTCDCLNIHVRTQRLKRNQAFLLCSDGFYRFCSDKMIHKKLRKMKSSESMELIMEQYFDEVFRQGAGDNITIIMLCVK